jgi:thiamine biosynthesis protein ThiS
VTIVVNGENREAPPGATILVLLSDLGVTPVRVAVELNGAVLRRAEFGSRILMDGDRVELVQFVGGG